MSQLCQTLADIANYFIILVITLLAIYTIVKSFNKDFKILIPTTTLGYLKRDLNVVAIAGFIFLFCSWITVGGATPESTNQRFNEIAGNCRLLSLIWFLDFILVIGADIFLNFRFKNTGENTAELSMILKDLKYLPLIYCGIFMLLGYFIEV